MEYIDWKQDIAEAGILSNHRPPGSQVADAAVAEPSAAESDILVLGDGEFPPRLLNVLAIAIEVARDGQRVSQVPSVGAERLAGAVGVCPGGSP
jgi:hypothetical protein